MGNETINKKWSDLLNSFNDLLKFNEYNDNPHYINFFKEEQKIMKDYKKQFFKKEINFNEIEKKFNLKNLNYEKFYNFLILNHKDMTISFQNYKKTLNDFLLKIKNLNPYFICKNIFNRNWVTFHELFEIIKLMNEIKNDNVILTKLIFKELYSILDRTVAEFCNRLSTETFQNISQENINQNPYLEAFLKFINLKINKNNFIILKNYSVENNKIIFESKSNPYFQKLKFNPIWQSINYTRNILEHSAPTNFYFINKEKQLETIANIYLLLGFNFYLISELNNNFSNNL